MDTLYKFIHNCYIEDLIQKKSIYVLKFLENKYPVEQIILLKWYFNKNKLLRASHVFKLLLNNTLS